MITTNNLILGTLRNKKFVKDAMNRELVSYSLNKISKQVALDLMEQKKIDKIIITDENKRLYGLVTLKGIQKEIENSLATRDSDERLRVGASVGTVYQDKKRIRKLYDKIFKALLLII